MKRFDVAVIATHISPAVGYGGVAESIRNLVRCWAAAGHSLCLCVSDGSLGGRIAAQAIGLPTNVRISLYRAILFKRWGFGLGAVWKVFAACFGAQVVYVSGVATWPVTLAAAFCALMRRPFVVSPRGGLMAGHVAEIKDRKPHKWLFYKFLTLPSLRAAQFIHVTTPLERDGVQALLPKARCEIIVNGLDLAEWPAVPRNRNEPLTICFVGRINPDKGINRFARIWLAGRQPGERLLVVGEGPGPYADELRGLAQQADGAIQLVGNVNRRGVHDVLAQSHFLVLPSGIEGNNERENFGNVVAEAMATGCPVLVSNGLAWDFIEPGGMGFVFERRDDAIGGSIDKARAVSENAYRDMCSRARSYAEENFPLAMTAAKLWALLVSLPVRSSSGGGLR